MFERFTESARRVVVNAYGEALTRKHNYIGTEHILLGLLREEEGVAARVLESLDITVERLRLELAMVPGGPCEAPAGQITFTATARELLLSAERHALARAADGIGSEHIVLALAAGNRRDERVPPAMPAPLPAAPPEPVGTADRLVERIADGLGAGAEVVKAALGRDAATASRAERLRHGLVKWAASVAVSILLVTPAVDRAIRVVEREQATVATAAQGTSQEPLAATRR